MHDYLVIRYGGFVPAIKICTDEHIVIRERLLDGIARGMYLEGGNIKAIVLERRLSEIDRIYTLWHELYHYFASVHKKNESFRASEAHANYFAALSCCPHVDINHIILTIAEDNNVTFEIARLRLQYEGMYQFNLLH